VNPFDVDVKWDPAVRAQSHAYLSSSLYNMHVPQFSASTSEIWGIGLHNSYPLAAPARSRIHSRGRDPRLMLNRLNTCLPVADEGRTETDLVAAAGSLLPHFRRQSHDGDISSSPQNVVIQPARR